MNDSNKTAGGPQRPGTALLALLAAAVGIGLLVVVPVGAYYECGGGAACHPELAFIVLAVLLACMLAYAARRISRDMAAHSEGSPNPKAFLMTSTGASRPVHSSKAATP